MGVLPCLVLPLDFKLNIAKNPRDTVDKYVQCGSGEVGDGKEEETMHIEHEIVSYSN